MKMSWWKCSSCFSKRVIFWTKGIKLKSTLSQLPLWSYVIALRIIITGNRVNLLLSDVVGHTRPLNTQVPKYGLLTVRFG